MWLLLKTLLLVVLIGSLRILSVMSLKARTNNLPNCYYLNFVSIFVCYSFQYTGLLNPSSNSFTNFTLSLLDKVRIGPYNFVYVILNVVSAIVDITQSLLQFNSRWILQLINGISKDLQKLLKYFSGIAIFTFLNTPLSAAVSGFKKLDLHLKDVELSTQILSGFPT